MTNKGDYYKGDIVRVRVLFAFAFKSESKRTPLI